MIINKRVSEEEAVVIAVGKFEYTSVTKDEIIKWKDKEIKELREKVLEYEIEKTFSELIGTTPQVLGYNPVCTREERELLESLTEETENPIIRQLEEKLKNVNENLISWMDHSEEQEDLQHITVMESDEWKRKYEGIIDKLHDESFGPVGMHRKLDGVYVFTEKELKRHNSRLEALSIRKFSEKVAARTIWGD